MLHRGTPSLIPGFVDLASEGISEGSCRYLSLFVGAHTLNKPTSFHERSIFQPDFGRFCAILREGASVNPLGKTGIMKVVGIFEQGKPLIHGSRTVRLGKPVGQELVSSSPKMEGAKGVDRYTFVKTKFVWWEGGSDEC
ncbi:hypothetical protein [Paenibacillus sp. SI8]|uniref:hypothetical protein n=1 Tax=unclassified Paenibacillus TaxID=185978 RepID=UPI00346792ED